MNSSEVSKNIFNIIIVEDEDLIQKNIVKKIETLDLGFNVVATALDGGTALVLIDKHLPDVLITDIKIPVMDGLELIKVVDSKYPFIKKVVLSGFDYFSFAQCAMKYHVVDYLLKPVKLDELNDVLMLNRLLLEKERNISCNKSIDAKAKSACSAKQIASMVEYYIKENYTREISFDDIAQKFNFNSSYLSKIFTKYIGENPIKYMTNLRINKAKHMLLSDKELAIKEIAEMVGYSDQFYFSRIFKNVAGISPASYRGNQQNQY